MPDASHHSILEPTSAYTYTVLFKPSDWQSRTHLLLLVCGVVVGAIAGWRAWSQQSTGSETAWAVVFGILSVYGVWTLTRELSTRSHIGVWVSIPLVLWVLWVGRELSLLIVFTALAQVRIVNRSGGKPAGWLDSLLVCVLTGWTVYYTENMLFWFSGLVAFILDAILHERRHRQWIFALLCVAVGLYLDFRNIPLMRELGFVTLPPWARYLFLLGAALVLMSFFVRLPAEHSPVFSKSRWRASLVVALLCAITPLFQGNLGLFASAFVWLSLVALAIDLVFRFVFSLARS